MTLGGCGWGVELVEGSATRAFDGEGDAVAFGEFFVAVVTPEFFHLLQNLY